MDGLESEKNKIRIKRDWFEALNRVSGNIGVFLLNIYEIEALILADIDIFNTVYKTSIKSKKIGNVMYKDDPKGFLKNATIRLRKQYKEHDCPILFKKLRYNVVKDNCRYFKDFHDEFCKILKIKRHPD